MTADAEAFLLELARGMPTSERLIICGFIGDPGAANPGNRWKPRPWRPGDPLPINSRCNGYVCVSSVERTDEGWRRRTSDCVALRAVMVDDVGTKVPHSAVEMLLPSAQIETSPGNYQWVYFLDDCRDMSEADALIAAFIRGKLLGADPGMAGVNRVARLPGFVNGKAKYGGAFQVTMRSWRPEKRYTVKHLVDAFGLELQPQRIRAGDIHVSDLHIDVLSGRSDLFNEMLKVMAGRRMLQRLEPGIGGWLPITCPWVNHHTDQVNDGAAIRLPHEDNNFYGAFKCHHGHCLGKGWSDLTDFLVDEITADMEVANEQFTGVW